MGASFCVTAAKSPGLDEAEIGQRLGRVYSLLLRLGDEGQQRAADLDGLTGQASSAAVDALALQPEAQTGV